MNPCDFVSGKKGESTTEKKKSFHKNEDFLLLAVPVTLLADLKS